MQPLTILNARSSASRQDGKRSGALSPQKTVALVYMPWGLFTRASIALGILKQCATTQGYQVDSHYLNIRFANMIGLERYSNISRNSVLNAEWFFSAHLFGEREVGPLKNSWDDLRSTAEGARLARELTDLAGNSEETCKDIVDNLVPQFIDDSLSEIDWDKYRVIGFSVTFAQTLSSLLLAKKIKEKYPDKIIMFGGANVDSEMGWEILKGFPWIDYVAHGEAEHSFTQLLDNIFSGSPFAPISGVSFRTNDRLVSGAATAQPINNLNESPMPDYTDYFNEILRFGIHKKYEIRLPFESSRGCWWGAKHHCTFCGLNKDALGYRRKESERVYQEIIALSKRYRCKNLYAVDNIMDMKYFSDLLPKLAEADLDLSIFYEIKANVTKEQVRRLASAGIKTIQPGIESLNSEILKLMRKGITAIQNIQLLKWCAELGIEVMWNILYGFPGEKPDQYIDQPAIFRMLYHLQPPRSVSSVVFERFSPYHFDSKAFNLTLAPDPIYNLLYPGQLMDLDKLAYYFIGDWGDGNDPAEYMRPTFEAFTDWTQASESRKVIFCYEKGPGFVTLYDSRPLANLDSPIPRRLILNEFQSEVYLFCDQQRSLKTIMNMLESSLHQVSEANVRSTLDKFVEGKLMFREGDNYLSLAVRNTPLFKSSFKLKSANSEMS